MNLTPPPQRFLRHMNETTKKKPILIIIIYDLKFKSLKNYEGQIEYRMNSLKNVQKWEIYANEKEYTKAIRQLQ